MTFAASTPSVVEQQAEQILRDLAETGGRAYAQTVAIVHALGMDAVSAILEEVRKVEEAGGLMTADGARRRTLGGVFLYIARARLPNRERRRIFHPEFGMSTPDLSPDGGPPPPLPAMVAAPGPPPEPHVEWIRARPKEPSRSEPPAALPSVAPPSSGVRPVRRHVRPASSEPIRSEQPPPEPASPPEAPAPPEPTASVPAEASAKPARAKTTSPRKTRAPKAASPASVVVPEPVSTSREQPSPGDVRAHLASIDWAPSAELHRTLRRVVNDFVAAASDLYAAEMASLVERSLTDARLLPPDRKERPGKSRRRPR